MNVERINALADMIEVMPHTTVSAEEGFSMANWSHDCGTPACIAGWAAYLAKGPGVLINHSCYDVAADFLDINVCLADELFEPRLGDVDLWDEIEPKHAAEVLRHLAQTGNVDWGLSE